MRVWLRAVTVVVAGAVVVAGVPALAATVTVRDAGVAGHTGAQATGSSAALGAARTTATRALVTPRGTPG